jgi:hypothetical protein
MVGLCSGGCCNAHAHAARVISASYVAPPATRLALAATSIAARC